MSEETTSTPAAPAETPAPKTTADFHAAAIAAMEAAEQADATPAPAEETAVKESEPAVVEKTEAKDDAPKPEEKKEEAPKTEEKDTLLKKSFETLAKEKAALRKERDAAKAEREELAKYRTLDNAVKNKDAMGVLAALGLPYSSLVDQLVGKKTESKAEAPEESVESKYLARIEALEQENKAAKFKADVTALESKITQIANMKKEKFPLSTGEEDFAPAVREYLLNYVRENEDPPGDTIEESIEIALEAMEERFNQQAAKWRKKLGLTAAETSSSVTTAERVVEPVKSVVTKSKTLSNSHTSAPATGITNPSNSSDYRRAALEALNKLD